MANNTRSVLVVGLGRFGSSVATTLDTMGQDVLAVDKDGELVNRWSSQIPTVQADMTDVMALEQLKQLRIDTANKINQQEAGNRIVDDRLLRKKDQLDKAIAEAEGTTEKQAAPKEQFADNKLFTADRVAAARARMKSKMGNLNSGLDPEMQDGVAELGARRASRAAENRLHSAFDSAEFF